MNRTDNSRLEQQERKMRLRIRQIFVVIKIKCVILLLKVTAIIVQLWTSKHCLDCSQFCLGVGNRNLRLLDNLVYFPILKLLQLKKALRPSEKKEGKERKEKKEQSVY